MPAYTQVENDVLVSRKPCLLYSITCTNTGSNEARVDVFDSRTANAPDRVLTLLCGAKETKQFSWKGLELTRGLFVDNVEKIEYITIEWEPLT